MVPITPITPNYTQLPTRTTDQLPSVRDGVAGPCDVQGAIFFVGLVKDGYTFGAAALPGAPLGAAGGAPHSMRIRIDHCLPRAPVMAVN